MSLEPKNLGGNDQFSAYKALFHARYHDPSRVIFDGLGRRVDFKPDDLTSPVKTDNAAHVCYGGRSHRWSREECWYQERAERIEWIGHALMRPSKIRHDREFYVNEKYLLRVPRDGQEMEYFCVIAENKGRDAAGVEVMEFITAYDIDWKTYSNYEGVKPPIFPEGVAAYSGKKRGKKKKGQD